MRKITQLFLVVLLMTLSMNNIKVDPKVKAQEQTEVVIDVEFDESDKLDVNIHELFPFNEYGIAIFSTVYVNEYEEEVFKSGIINDKGTVLIEPVYDSIHDFNLNWYIGSKYPTDVSDYSFSIISKKDGSVELEPIYDYIERIFDYDLFIAAGCIESNIAENFGYSYNCLPFIELKKSISGKVMDAEIPLEFDEFGISEAYTFRINNDFRVMNVKPFSGIIEIGKSLLLEDHSWFTSRNGQIINDTYYSSLSTYAIIDDNFYFSYAKSFSNDGTNKGPGLIKVVPKKDNLEIIEMIIDNELFDTEDIVSVSFFNQSSHIVRIRINSLDGEADYFFDVKSNKYLTEEPNTTSIYDKYITYDEENLATLEIDDQIFSNKKAIFFYEELGWYILNELVYVPDQYDKNELVTLNQMSVYDINEKKIKYEFVDINIHSLIMKGYGQITVRANDFDSLTYEGVIGREGVLLEPEFYRISEFSNQGFAKICRDNNATRCGLINDEYEIVVEPEYIIEPLTYDSIWSNIFDAPKFDDNGHVRLLKSEVIENGVNYFFGLSSKEGIIVNALYDKAYFKDGYYYTLLNNRFEVFNRDRSVYFEIDPLDGAHSLEGYQFRTMEFVSDKYFVFGYSYIPEGFIDYEIETEFFGVLDIEGNVFLEPEYKNIKFDRGYFYLEKIDPNNGELVTGVMNENKEMIVPFDNGYSSVSDFVGEYAIGQAGEKINDSPQLFSFFKSVKANSNDFKLDVLNSQGEVVGDLSENFEFATLLSTDGENTTALVKKDGVFYLGHLVQTERVVDNPVDDDPEDEYEPEVIVDVDTKDFPKFNVTGLDDFEKLGIVLTEDEISNNVIVKLVLKTLLEEELSVADKKILNDFISKNTNLQGGKKLFFDISIMKIIGELSSSINTLSSPITLSFELPFAFWDTDFELLRVHDNKVESIKYDYNKTTHMITFSTDKFSTYALVEVMESEEEETPVIEEDSEFTTPVVDEEKQTDEEQKKIPDTSDKSSRNVALLSLMFGLIFVFSSKKSGKKIT